MRISDWSSDVCSSDLPHAHRCRLAKSIGARAILLAADTDEQDYEGIDTHDIASLEDRASRLDAFPAYPLASSSTAYIMFTRSEEHTSELQSLMRISYAVFC